MKISERDCLQAQTNAQAVRAAGHAVSARYDARHGRVVVGLNAGVLLTIPVDLLKGLAGAARADLSEIEISPAGTGLHWPRLDADPYIPALLQGPTAQGAGVLASRRKRLRDALVDLAW